MNTHGLHSKKAKIDVLLPYWGDFSLLKKAVDSVLAQTEKDFRLLIIDDYYPSDDAKNLYSNFPDQRVTYHRHKENFGLVKNYNYALEQVRADHFVMMGCDDVMLSNYLETALKKIGDADYYQPGIKVIDENGTYYLPLADKIKQLLRPRQEGVHKGESVAVSLCHGNWTYFPSLLWKTATLKKYGYNPDLPNTQDIYVQFEILTNGGSLFIDNEVTFCYRRSAQSFSSKAKSGTRFQEEDKMYDALSKHFYKIGWKKAARAARARITVRIHKILS